MTTKTKSRASWVSALLNKIERINSADTPYHVQVGEKEIIVRHGTNEIGFADNGRDGEYLLDGILWRISEIDAANPRAKK